MAKYNEMSDTEFFILMLSLMDKFSKKPIKLKETLYCKNIDMYNNIDTHEHVNIHNF